MLFLTGATSVHWFDTLAELRSITGGTTSSSINVAIARGYSTPRDGGGGPFTWVPSSVAPTAPADDNGTVIVPAGAYTGYWQRLYTGAMDLAWFGATTGGANAGQGNVTALTNALKAVAAAGGGTINVSALYPLGYTDWVGIGVGPIDSYSVVPSPIHGLTIAGTKEGAGFTFMSLPQSGAVNAALKFSGCRRLTLRNLTLDGSAGSAPADGGAASTALAIGFVSLQRCTEARIVQNRFTNGSFNSQFTLQSISGTANRYESNVFQNFGGITIGYVNANEHEEGGQIIGNRFDTTTGSHNALYTTIRNGLIANNCFTQMSSGALMLELNTLTSDTTENLAITGNSFYNCGFAIRSDFGGGAIVPMKNIAITGNVIEKGGPATAIGIYPCQGLTITGNVILDFSATYVVQLLACSHVIMSNNIIEWSQDTSPPAAWPVLISTYPRSSSNVTNVVIDGNSIIGYRHGIQAGKDPNAPYTFTGITISSNLISCQAVSGDAGHGIYITGNTSNVLIYNNRIDPSATVSIRLFSTAKLSGNQTSNIMLDTSVDPNVTYYWEEQGHRIYKPASAPPTVPPSDVTSWNAGDLVYNNAPASGAPVGWVYTPAGWKTFGTIV